MKAKPQEVVGKVQQVLDHAKAVERELDQVKKELNSGNLDGVLASQFTVGDVTAVVASVPVSDMGELRDMADMVRDKIGSGVVLLGAAGGDKVNFVCMATKDVVGKGIHCGNIVKAAAQAAGGNGGGRPDMAQAGGKDPAAMDQALAAGKEAIQSMVG